MILVDRMFMKGLGFVFRSVLSAAEAELGGDVDSLREELLAAEMRLELGEITEEEFAEVEAQVLPRLREIRARELSQIEVARREALSARGVTVEVEVEGIPTETEADADRLAPAPIVEDAPAHSSAVLEPAPESPPAKERRGGRSASGRAKPRVSRGRPRAVGGRRSRSSPGAGARGEATETAHETRARRTGRKRG